MALALVGGFGTVVLHGLSIEDDAATLVATRSDPPTTSTPAPNSGFGRMAGLFDPTLSSHMPGAPLGRAAPLRPHADASETTSTPELTIEAAQQPLPAGAPDIDTEPLAPAAPIALGPVLHDIPVPTPRPAIAQRATPQARRQIAALPADPTPAATTRDAPSLLERMFGAPTAPAPATPALAYAAPGDVGTGLFGSRGPVAPSAGTAVYNIVKHTVMLPDGTQLEAHSGLGVHLDDPRSVTYRMHGATPPSLYELTPREAPFHGVRALRLTPVLEGTTFGRGGLLAHTFMLGPRGDSNGCVVFRNYAAFLAAYESGQIRRLLVVSGV